jgi:hypothetical protein
VRAGSAWRKFCAKKVSIARMYCSRAVITSGNGAGEVATMPRGARDAWRHA